LCRHSAPGYCTWLCQYKLFIKSTVLPSVLLFAGIGILHWNSGPAGQQTVRDGLLAIGLVLAVAVPLVVILNRKDGDT